MTDDKIVELYFNRDEQAISLTKVKYENYLYTIAYNILRDKPDSDECVNDTYMGAWNSIPPKKPNVLKTYLSKLTRNISLNKLRYNSAKKRNNSQYEIAIDELKELECTGESVEDTFDEKELARFIDNFISKLEINKCVIFLARYWYFYSIHDIAKKLGYSESKVKMILKRTRDNLFEELKKEGLL